MNKKALYVLVAIVIFGLLGLNAYVLFTRGTQVVSQGQKGGSPEASLTPTPLVSKSVPAALRPGLDKLGELYQGYPTLIAATSFQVVFRGRVQSYSGNTLVLADGKKALTLQLRDDTNVIVIAPSGSGSTVERLRKAEKSITPGDLVEATTEIDPFSGMILVIHVARVKQ